MDVQTRSAVNPRFAEFVALAAMMTSLAALSTDAVLPALPAIGRDLGIQRANDGQLIISLLFFGMVFGQLIYGPLSDRVGRRPAIFAGFALFMAGSLLALLSTSFPMMLAGRVLQGVGAAGPRIVTVALVRDQFSGRGMARVMSFVMTVFILVPVVAPLLGQTLLLIADWRAIFGVYLALALITVTWFGLRQPETLDPSKRLPLSLARFGVALREIVGIRAAIGYTLVGGLITGPFMGYLNSAQQIFQEQYGLGTRFALYFATLALALGGASFVNSRLVMRLGMRALSGWSLRIISGLSIVFFAIALGLTGGPPLWALMAYLLATFFCIGILFGNLNSLAMQPLGHIAGIGAAVVGALSTLISLLLGMLIGQLYNGTVLPLVGGFMVCGIAAVVLMGWIEQKA